MKQHITIEQLNELSENGREKLIKLFTNKNWFPHYTGTHLMLHNLDTILSECFSIGRMIEFLSYQDNNICAILINRDNEYGYTYKYVGDIKNFDEDELCDVLWEAVKEALKK